MGIKGLLPFLKNASREVDIKNFSGSTVAVDAYCWLHKGAFSCAEKLGKGEPTDGYVYYCMKMVNMLLAAGVKPILVFDGQNLPSKSITEIKRRENREKYRKMAKQYLREGKMKEAKDCFQQSVDVTPEMAHQLILACRKKNVDCIVAPYEADAQLAYLVLCGIAQIVITEDSDLVVFGCERVIFKMDMFGRGVMVEKSAISKCFGARAENFTFEKFRYMCILSGCDYLPSLSGIGLAKSAKFFNLIVNPDLYRALSKLPNYLKMPNLVVTTEYKDGFVKANNTFLYQLVFCPLTKKLVPLNCYPPDVNPKDMNYAGSYLPEDVAFQLALGNIHLHTMKPFGNAPQVKQYNSSIWDQKESKENHQSIWDQNYKICKKLKPEKKEEFLSQTKGTSVIVSSEKIFKESYGPQKREREVPRADALTEEEIAANLTDNFMLPASKKTNLNSGSPLKDSSYRINAMVESQCGREIVRSRFFIDSPSPGTTKSSSRSTASWLDAIETEYGMGSPSQAGSLDFSRKSPFVSLDKKITLADRNANLFGSGSCTERTSKEDKQFPARLSATCNDSPVNGRKTTYTKNCAKDTARLDNGACNETAFSGSKESLFSIQPKKVGIHKFNWGRSLSNGFGVKNNHKLQNSPRSELDFKSASPLSNCDETSEVVSQNTICSIDKDSFALSPRTSSSSLDYDDDEGRSLNTSEVVDSLHDSTDLHNGDCQAIEVAENNHRPVEKEKPLMKSKLGTGSRCSGLRKRVNGTQMSIKDMMAKFSFDRSRKVIGK